MNFLGTPTLGEGIFERMGDCNEWFTDPQNDFLLDQQVTDPGMIYIGCKFEVTFKKNNGTTDDSVKVFTGGKVIEPIRPIKDGHTFGGWFNDIDLVVGKWIFTEDVVTDNMTLYAKWIPNPPPPTTGGDSYVPTPTYTLTFDTTGGSTISPRRYTYYQKPGIPEVPTKEGFTFSGWYKERAFENAWNFDEDFITKDTTLYAKWRATTYDVTFETNKGSAVQKQSVEFGKLAEKPEIPTKVGSTFEGWYKEATLTTAWNFEQDAVYQDITLYAKWIGNNFTLTFETNGGSTIESQSIAYNKLATEPVAPMKTGYSFAGWYKEPTFETAWNFKRDTLQEDTTLYAKWTENRYSVFFETNEGTNIPVQSIVYNQLAKKPVDPMKMNSIFEGWYKENTFETVWNFDQNVIKENTTLYAKWNPTRSRLTFETNEGTLVPDQMIVYNERAEKPNDPEKTGFTFAGWYKEEVFTNIWDFSTDTITKPTTLYAKWKENNYTLIFESNEGTTVRAQTIAYNQRAEKPAEPIKEGFTFAGWYKESSFSNEWNFSADVVKKDTILYAKWTENRYNVTFETNEGTKIAAQSIKHNQRVNEPKAPTKTNATFAGWYKESTFKTEWNFTKDPVKNDITLYAKWTLNSYTVSFNTAGGTAIPDQSIIYKKLASKPAAPTKEGFLFGSWYKENTFTNEWNFATDLVKENITLYAKWTRVPSQEHGGSDPVYTLTFNTTGGTPIPSKTYSYNQKPALPIAPTKAGYTLAGWYKEAALTTEWNFEKDLIKDHTKLYAKWAESSDGDTLTVTFESNKGTAVPSQFIARNEKVIQPKAPTKTDYTFAGWYKEVALTTQWNFATNIVTENTTLYAKWSENHSSCSNSFPDIQSHWAKESIQAIACRGIVIGYLDGTFRPNDPIKREHVALMFNRAFDLQPVRSNKVFTDVPEKYVYNEAITKVYEAAIFDGVSATHFKPIEHMTRAQMAKVLVNAFNLQSKGTATFEDVSSDHWAAEYISILAGHEIALGDNGKFKPKDPVTRAQFSAFMYRALNN